MHNCSFYSSHKPLIISQVLLNFFAILRSPDGQLGLAKYGPFKTLSELVLYNSYIRGIIKNQCIIAASILVTNPSQSYTLFLNVAIFLSPGGRLGLGRYGPFTIPSELVLHTSYIPGFIKIYTKF